MRYRLTEKEKALIERFLRFYRDLDSGVREPTTPDQRRFVKVCREQIAPTSEHEIAYMKFRARRLIGAQVSGRDQREPRSRQSPPQGATGCNRSVVPIPKPERRVPDQTSVEAHRKRIEAEQRAKEREEEKRRAAEAEATVPHRGGSLNHPQKADRTPNESSLDDIPEYEEGYPNPSWYPGRDNSSMDPYGRNRYKR